MPRREDNTRNKTKKEAIHEMHNNNNALQLFKYENNTVRTVSKDDGSIWFVAIDVCKVLGLNNVSRALNSLDNDEKMTLTISKGHSGQRGGAQFMYIISESGLYSLVFKSRKDENSQTRILCE